MKKYAKGHLSLQELELGIRVIDIVIEYEKLGYTPDEIEVYPIF